MFNFYWQERSFYYATKEDIENHIKELNKMYQEKKREAGIK